MLDHTLSLLYRVGRRAAREGRRRVPGLYRQRDLRRLGAALAGRAPRDLLLDFAALAPWASSDGSHPPVETWPDDREAWLSADEAAAVVAKADAACAHRFDLLGSGPVHLGDPIDWHRDFKSGYRWPVDIHHLAIRWDAVPDGVDIKVPWELSRCQHFASFGLADWISGDDRYYRGFKSQVAQWIAANPCGFGVNWLCAMDVAIRAVNWLTAAMLFRHRIEADDDHLFIARFVESLWLHGCHLRRNLEWQGPRSANLNNHFLADLCGLLAVGALFRHCPQGRRWLDFARRWLETEIRRQVFDDGTVYETSTSYHRLDLEMFQWAEAIGHRVGMPFSEPYRDRLARMAAFVRAYTCPSGAAAQYGDNDSGRLLTAGIDDGRNHLYLTDPPCGFGGRANRLLLRGSVRSHDTPVVGPTPGRQESRSAAEMAAGNRPSLIESFPRGGYWFMRCAGAWVGIRAGIVSHHGAHAHCDQLSFVLAVGDDDFIVDPGTGVYSADVPLRNRYRSTAAHNACRVNGWEANSFREGKLGLFGMADDTRTEVSVWHCGPTGLAFAGRHHGFERFRPGLLYERSLELGPGRLVIEDTCHRLEAGDQLDWSIQFAPGVGLACAAGGSATASAGQRSIRIAVDPRLALQPEEGGHSPAYGVELPAPRLAISWRVPEPGPATCRVRIEWDHPGTADC